MEYNRARGKLPPELDGLLASQMQQAIDEANLGLADKRIAERLADQRYFFMYLTSPDCR